MTPGTEQEIAVSRGQDARRRARSAPLVRAMFWWWVVSLAASIAVGIHALPWLDVLRYGPHRDVPSDLGLLHERWFERLGTGESAGWLRAALFHGILWRTLSSVPAVWVIAALRTPVGQRRPAGVRLWTRVPQFVALSASLQLTTTVAVLFAVQHVRAAAWALETRDMGRAWLHALLGFAGAGAALTALAVMDLARLACIHPLRSAPARLVTPLLDALELLWRSPTRTFLWTLSYMLGAIGAGIIGLGCASRVNTSALEGWGAFAAWGLAQLGVLGALGWRVYVWQRLLASCVGPAASSGPARAAGLHRPFTTYAPRPSAIARNDAPPAPSPDPDASRDA